MPAGRMIRIAICGALFALCPPAYVKYAWATRLKSHPHLIDSDHATCQCKRRRIIHATRRGLVGCRRRLP